MPRGSAANGTSASSTTSSPPRCWPSSTNRATGTAPPGGCGGATSTRPPRTDAWAFLRAYVLAYDASVWTMEQFIPDTFEGKLYFFPPGIDPVAPKNVALSPGVIDEVCARHGIDRSRPIVLQVSRFDRWKDPVGVIEAFRSVRRAVPGAQLVLDGYLVNTPEEAAARTIERLRDREAAAAWAPAATSGAGAVPGHP